MRRAVTVCLLALATAGPAAASVDQESILQDDPLIVYPSSEEELERTFATLRALGVDRVRVSLFWNLVAPRPKSERRPSFGSRGPAWPGSYPRGAWRRYDNVVRLASRHDVGVLFTITGPAPNWAAGRNGTEYSVYKPDAREFRAFVTAAGRRYSGWWPPGSGSGDPQSGLPSLPTDGGTAGSGAGRRHHPARGPLVGMERGQLPELAVAAVAPQSPAGLQGRAPPLLAAPLPTGWWTPPGTACEDERARLGRDPAGRDGTPRRPARREQDRPARQVPARALLPERELHAVQRQAARARGCPDTADRARQLHGRPPRPVRRHRLGPSPVQPRQPARPGGTRRATRSRSGASTCWSAPGTAPGSRGATSVRATSGSPSTATRRRPTPTSGFRWSARRSGPAGPSSSPTTTHASRRWPSSC